MQQIKIQLMVLFIILHMKYYSNLTFSTDEIILKVAYTDCMFINVHL